MKNKYFWIFLLIITAFILALFAMGRLWICECGYVKLWHGDVISSENSQHLMDWYTLSHIIHGFGFYALIWFVSKKILRKNWSLGGMFIAAVILEVGWEILENTDWVINYYRSNTVSLGYVGDSIINSIGDVLSMSLGFWIASRLPIKYTVMLFIAMELIAAYFIRDNLLLNILMFIHPFEFVKTWQLGL